MAYYAFLDANNFVTEVIPGVDETELIEGQTPEQWYGKFRGQKCVRTSYNRKIRKNFAGVGYYYDEDWDAFIPPKAFDSWIFNYETFGWEAPVPKPNDEQGFVWFWGELRKEWVKVPITN